MLPQHGGVPNFKLTLSGPAIAGLSIVSVGGILLSLVLHGQAEPGDVAAANLIRLVLVITFLLVSFILFASTGKWWHPHLRAHKNSQSAHRHRTRNHKNRPSKRRH